MNRDTLRLLNSGAHGVEIRLHLAQMYNMKPKLYKKVKQEAIYKQMQRLRAKHPKVAANWAVRKNNEQRLKVAREIRKSILSLSHKKRTTNVPKRSQRKKIPVQKQKGRR